MFVYVFLFSELFIAVFKFGESLECRFPPVLTRSWDFGTQSFDAGVPFQFYQAYLSQARAP